MVEVFITDIESELQAINVVSIIKIENIALKINFDLNETDLSYPCGHTILRVEGSKINSENILNSVKNQGFKCEILEDKICTQKDTL
jgi:hypothetical protein